MSRERHRAHANKHLLQLPSRSLQARSLDLRGAVQETGTTVRSCPVGITAVADHLHHHHHRMSVCMYDCVRI